VNQSKINKHDAAGHHRDQQVTNELQQNPPIHSVIISANG
jgi:hypothetical protein